jgi:uncharacterized protein (DUF2384 family)
MTNLEKIIDQATEILGDRDRALDWIEKKSATLGASPRRLSETAHGTNKVLLHLANISRHDSKA